MRLTLISAEASMSVPLIFDPTQNKDKKPFVNVLNNQYHVNSLTDVPSIMHRDIDVIDSFESMITLSRRQELIRDRKLPRQIISNDLNH